MVRRWVLNSESKNTIDSELNYAKMKTRLLLAIVATAAFLSLNIRPASAQTNGFDFRSFMDPDQIQKRLMDGYRQQLEITDDGEWKVVEERIQKVMNARRELGFGSGMNGLARMFGGGAQRDGQAMGRFSAFMPKQSLEEEALQRALDAKASEEELKAALAKFAEARRQKQASLEKAQADLRALLTVRQEVAATLSGLL